MTVFGSLIEWTEVTFLPYGPLGLFVVSFIEASFFPIPPDILLIAMGIANPDSVLLYALIVTVASTLGGMLGYGIGYAGEHAILEKVVSRRNIERVHKYFEKYGAWAVFIAGFTPLPYKVFTIASGIAYLNFKKFVLASFFGRGLRFFAEAVLIMMFGAQVRAFIENPYFDAITIAVGVIVILAIVVYFKSQSRHHNR